MNKEDFECQRCGACCTILVLLTKTDICRIKRIGYSEEDFVMPSPIRRDREKKCLKLIDNKCYFLGQDGDRTYCKIYRYRPRTCHVYPFYKENIEDCRPRTFTYKNRVV